MTTEKRYCEDCKWAKRQLFIGVNEDSRCTHHAANVSRENFYNRPKRASFRSCWFMRTGDCGPEGKLWEPR